MRALGRVALAVAAGFGFVGLVAAQSATTGTPTPPPPSASTSTSVAAPLAGTCDGDPPPTVGCLSYRCSGGAWVPVTKTSGACSDGDPCHYGKTCNTSGQCVGGGAVVCTGCQVCNGTSTCGNLAAGSACSSVPGLASACSCNATGTCQTATGTSAKTAFCWDARGNMTAKFTVPPANVCPAACP